MKQKPGRKPSNKPKKQNVTICLSPKATKRLRQIVGSESASQWIEDKIMEEQYTDDDNQAPGSDCCGADLYPGGHVCTECGDACGKEVKEKEGK